MTTRVTEGARRERHDKCFLLGLPPSFLASRGEPLNARARALLLLNLKKKRDCSQSSGLQSSLLQLRSIWVLPAATRSQKNLKHYDNRPGETLRLLEQLCQHCNSLKSSVWCFGCGWGTRKGGCTCCLHLNMLEKKLVKIAYLQGLGLWTSNFVAKLIALSL